MSKGKGDPPPIFWGAPKGIPEFGGAEEPGRPINEGGPPTFGVRLGAGAPKKEWGGGWRWRGGGPRILGCIWDPPSLGEPEVPRQPINEGGTPKFGGGGHVGPGHPRNSEGVPEFWGAHGTPEFGGVFPIKEGDPIHKGDPRVFGAHEVPGDPKKGGGDPFWGAHGTPRFWGGSWGSWAPHIRVGPPAFGGGVHGGPGHPINEGDPQIWGPCEPGPPHKPEGPRLLGSRWTQGTP